MSDDEPSPRSVGTRTRSRARTGMILGVLALALGAGMVLRALGFAGGHPAAIAPRDALPSSSFLTISVDLRAVRAATWWPTAKTMVGGDTGKLLGLPSLETVCGYDPTAQIDEIAVAVPEGGDRGDFGVAMSGALDTEALVACAKKIVKRPAANGQTDNATELSVHDRQSFHVLDQDGAPRFALREGGPYLVGRGQWLERMIDSAAGAAPRWPSADADKELLRTVRGDAPASAGDLGGRALIATAVLPADVREKVRHEMASETDEASKAAMNGILGVATAAIAITLPPPPGPTPNGTASSAPPPSTLADLVVELRCESDDACAAVEKLALAKRLQWSKDFRLRFLGLGGALDSFTVKAEGRALHAKLSFDPDAVVRAAQRLLRMQTPDSPAAPPLFPTPSAVPAPPVAPVAPATPVAASAPSASVVIPAKPRTDPLDDRH